MPGADSENRGLAAYLDTILSNVEEKIASPETNFERGQHEKEALRAVVGEKLGKELAATPPLPNQTQSGHGDTPSYNLPELKPQVDELLSIALSKDLDEAINRARKIDDPAILDAFHDALTDKLYDQLVETGKLKRVK
jgi:hypothetical protein